METMRNEMFMATDQSCLNFHLLSSFSVSRNIEKFERKNFIHSTHQFLNRNKFKNVLITLCNINSIKYPCIHDFYGAIFNVNESYSVSIWVERFFIYKGLILGCSG